MIRKGFILAFIFIAILSLPVFADRIHYNVDVATVSPQPAVVVARGKEGQIVLFFDVSSFHVGDTFTFRLDMYANSGTNGAAYPASAEMRLVGDSNFDAVFDPAVVTFPSAGETVSVNVTLTLKDDDYSNEKKVKCKIKAFQTTESGLGSGPGLRVIAKKPKGH